MKSSSTVSASCDLVRNDRTSHTSNGTTSEPIIHFTNASGWRTNSPTRLPTLSTQLIGPVTHLTTLATRLRTNAAAFASSRSTHLIAFAMAALAQFETIATAWPAHLSAAVTA